MSTKWLWRANEALAAETGADGSDERKPILLKSDSFGRKLDKEKVGIRKRVKILRRRHRVLILARILLAVPGPVFLVYSAIQHFEVTTAGWSITQVETGRSLALAVGLILAPVWILSLLIAQIDRKPAQKFAIGSRVCVKRSNGDKSFGYVKEYNEKTRVYKLELATGTLEKFDEAAIEKKPAQRFANAQKFAKGSRVCVKRSNGDKSFGYVKEYNEKTRVYELELATGTLDKFDEAAIEKKPAQRFANGSRVLFVERGSEDKSFGYVKEYNEETQVYKVELDIPTGTFKQCGEDSMRDASPVISRERLVRLWKYFLSLWKWDQRIWTWPKAFEAALFWGCVYGYVVLYQSNAAPNYLLGALIFWVVLGPPVIALILYTVTNIVRSIIDYQDNQNAEYHTFVNLQAARLSILTIFGAFLTVYALSAMSRVVIPYNLVVPFVELAYRDITCTDRDAFWTAFNASFKSFNASCHALPNCGYASFESLCQAVQYAPMVQAESVDIFKVLLFNCVAWVLGSLLVFGTGRASLKNGYAQLLSKHMLVAMVLGLGQSMSAFYSLMRLSLLVPKLGLPRPAAYFDKTGLMSLELPLYCYGNTCTYYDFGGTIIVHVLIVVAFNFDFLKKYASAIGAGDQAAIKKLKEKMRKEKIWNEEIQKYECKWSDEAPYFYFIPATFVKECDDKRLPPMQVLDDDEILEKIQIRLVDAFEQAEKEARMAKEKVAAEKAAAEKVAAEKVAAEKVAVEKAVKGIDIGKGIDESTQSDEKEAAEKAPAEVAVAKKENQGINKALTGRGITFKIKDILVVSHRWEENGRPDVNGAQLQAIKEYLKEHPEIKWVWFDYSSMPQKIGRIDTRSKEERAEFQLMLECITNLYLTAQVLILLDGSYASRFWTLTEAWCSMQTATKDGLKNSISSTEDADFTGSDVKVGSRCTIKHIHTADDKHDVHGLIDKVSKKTAAEMVSHLEKPDVLVTNAKDKETMLPKILKYDEEVTQRFKKPQSDQSPSQPNSGKPSPKKAQVAPSDSGKKSRVAPSEDSTGDVTAFNDQ